MRVAAIILARGGSKGIPNKNIVQFAGRPLISWTIRQCFEAGVTEVYVSSDSHEILDVATIDGARVITRPAELATDSATSEAGWIHALDVLENQSSEVDWILAPQVTSPLRDPRDMPRGLEQAKCGLYDSLFSCVEVEDVLIWENSDDGLESLTYDWRRRQRRQDMPKRYLENGSFYLFKPSLIRATTNRFGGRIGVVPMQKWSGFEIDTMEDLDICESLMQKFVLGARIKESVENLTGTPPYEAAEQRT